MNEKNELTGVVLQATDLLEGSYFEDAVILIAVHDENGSFGLMLNRPSHMPISEVFTPVPDMTDPKRPFYIGGPVDEDGLHLINITEQYSQHHGLQIYPGVELGGEWEDLEEVLSSDPLKTFLFLGYSGWDSGQLEGELTEGSWDVHKPDVFELLKNWHLFSGLQREEMSEILKDLKKD